MEGGTQFGALSAIPDVPDRAGASPSSRSFDWEKRTEPARFRDLDNLIKPTLDAMERVFGLRQWRGGPQPADDQVAEIRAGKRKPEPGEAPGARIDVWLIEADPE